MIINALGARENFSKSPLGEVFIVLYIQKFRMYFRGSLKYKYNIFAYYTTVRHKKSIVFYKIFIYLRLIYEPQISIIKIECFYFGKVKNL